MSTSEGAGRVIFCISVAAWAALGLGFVGAAGHFFGSRGSSFEALLVFGLGALVFVVVQGFAWILAGFVGPTQSKYGLLWPRSAGKRNKRALQRPIGEAKKPLRGIGGWLMFFILTLGLLSPLRALGEMAKSFSDTEKAYPALLQLPVWASYKTASWSLMALVTALFIAAAYRLWKIHVPRSVSFAIAVLWLGGPAMGVAAYAMATWFFGDVPVDYEVVKGFLQSLAYATVWTLYLKLSRRVKNTYQDPAGFVREEPRT